MAFTPFTTLSRSSTRHVGLAPQRRLIHTTPRAPCILHSPIQQQSRANISCQGVLNTDVSHSESWALNARAAVLSLKEEELTEHIQSTPDNAWLAVCDPQRLFALRELVQLLGADVKSTLQLVQQEPSLLDVSSRSLEENVKGLQAVLQLRRADLTQLLFAQPQLLLQGTKAVMAVLQQAAWGLGVPATGPDAANLLQLLVRQGPDALCDANTAVQMIQPIVTALSLKPSDALALLRREVAAGQDLEELLSPAAVSALASDWRALSEEMGLPLRDVMAAVTAQLAQPDARYALSSAELLRADVATLEAASQVSRSIVCRLLLSAPRLASVPTSFYQLLLQYILFLVPRWRQQLEAMPPVDAGTLLAQLFETDGNDVEDVVSTSSSDALFLTADMDYNQELAVLEALLDHGMQAPKATAPGQIRAGRVWRLLYLCNPRLALSAQHNSQAQGSSPANSPWSWMMGLQLPLPLVDQLQKRGVLSCELPRSNSAGGGGGGGGGAATAAAGSTARAGVPPPPGESLWEVVSADAATFCSRHPGYAHWLHNASFELEWGSSKAAVPVATWDV